MTDDYTIYSSSRPDVTLTPEVSGLLLAILWVAFAYCLSLMLPASLHSPASDRESATPGQTVAMTRAQAVLKERDQALIAYVSDRWNLDPGLASEIVVTANKAAAVESVDPLLVLAVIAQESTFVHTGNAGNMSESVEDSEVDPLVAHGLMQVAGRSHPEKMPVDALGRIRVTTTAENIFIGTKVLAEYLRRESGNLTRALQRYNGNMEDSSARFATKVVRYQGQLRRALLDS